MPPPFDPATLDWNLLRVLGAVLQHGSLTRAAERLGSSQPTLSRQIAALESALGTPLFERGARRLLPTAAAQALAEPASRMLAAAQACAQVAGQRQAAAARLAGSVRLTASEVVAVHVLPPLLVALAERYPLIQIELVASDRLDNLLEHEADIALRMLRPTQGTLITRHIADWPLGLYLHRRLLPADGRAFTLADIDSVRKLGFDQSTALADGYRRAGFAVQRHDFVLRCDHQVVHLAALRAGLGLGVAMVPLAARLPELVRVLPELPLPVLPLWLTAHRELRASRRLKVVFDWLAEALAAWGGGAPAAVATAARRQRPPPTSTMAPVV